MTNLRAFYHPVQEQPYIVVPYPPVYHLVARIAVWFTGDFLVGGRLVCVASVFRDQPDLWLPGLYASPRRIPCHVRASGALLSALLCFGLDSLSRYIPEMGADAMAVLITFLGTFLFIRNRTKSAWQYAAFCGIGIGGLTKQTMVAGPSACLVASTMISGGRAFRLLLFSFTLSAGVLGCLAWATKGEVLRHLFLYNAGQPFSMTHLILGMQENVTGMIPIASIACLALLPYIYRGISTRRSTFVRWLRAGVQSSPYRRAIIVLGMQLFFGLLVSFTYGKLGSGYHYFLEWNLACCPLAGLFFVRVLESWRRSSRYALGGAALFLLVFMAALTGFPDSLRRINSVFRITPGERRIQDVRFSSAAAALRSLKKRLVRCSVRIWSLS